MLERLISQYDPRFNHSGVNGERLAKRLNAVSEIGRTTNAGSYRLGFSKEERQAKKLVKQWMIEAGLKVKEDEAGNVFGSLAGKTNRLIISGSHVDSVPNGGHFDGPLGVLSALEVAEAWKEEGFIPNYSYEVVIFSDEEGSRFNGGFTGSSALVGDLDVDRLRNVKDKEGRPFHEVLGENGLSIDTIPNAKRNLEDIDLFVELHIEQGKRLEKQGLPVGIVTGIAGPRWIEFIFQGEAGHAGNTPMNDRKDALPAASAFILSVQRLPQSLNNSAVATVGKLDVYPNGVNVIPGQVKLYVDLRDIFEETRDKLFDKILREAEFISKAYGVAVTWTEKLKERPVRIPLALQNILTEAVKHNGIHPLHLPSGAGHDAMIVGRHIPTAMIFVQSKNGISHNPAEWSTLNDCVQGVHVLKTFLEKRMGQ